MAQTKDSNVPPRSSARPPSALRYVTTGLSIAVIGSAALALIECLLTAIVAAENLHFDLWPLGLTLAAVGKAAVTHTLFWLPLMAALAVGHWVRARRVASSTPEPLLWALFVSAGGLAVAPAGLVLAGRDSRILVLAACAGAIALGAGTYVAIRAFSRRRSARRSPRITIVATCICGLFTIVLGIAFVRSPLFNPAAYRVSQKPLTRTSGKRPNVLLIVVDTVRADHVGCYGDDRQLTPFLDEWAAKSIVFERTAANGIWTAPSHASMFTGLSVRRHGTDFDHLWLDDGLATVADVLRAGGYVTAAFSNNPWVAPQTNITKGFEVCHVICHLRHLNWLSLESVCEKWGLTPIVPWLDGDYGAAATNHLVSQWLDTRAEADAPFFLFINYMEAHLPYRVPKRYRRMYLADEEQVDRSYDLRHRVFGDIVPMLSLTYNIEGGEFLSLADREILKRQYAATIRYLDDRVREMIGMFEQRGLLENTLVVVTSDHGEHLDTHGMWAHSFLTYDDIARVPLLVREPGREQGVRIATPVQLSDLYPTIVNATLGTSLSGPGYDTRDLLALANVGGAPRVAIVEYNGHSREMVARMRRHPDPVTHHRAEPQVAAVDGRYKYMLSRDGQQELYDLLADPGELHSLHESHANLAARLARVMRAWSDAVPQYRPDQTGGAPELPPDVLRQLRSLGYVGGD